MKEDYLMQPLPIKLDEKLQFKYPLIGFYDAPDEELFGPVTKISKCLFAYFDNWAEGETLLISQKYFGCRGCGRWLAGLDNMQRDKFLTFLAETEGLRASKELMAEWVDANPTYKMEHNCLFIGPLKPKAWDYLKTVTFFVNPDQLSSLMIGAAYHASSKDPDPVIAPFGSGCGQLVPMFKDLNVPQAIIGGTDIAMRKHLPADILTFTVTRPMYERLCSLDEKSFLYKPFLKGLQEERVQQAQKKG